MSEHKGGRWIWSRISNRLLTPEEWERERVDLRKKNQSQLSKPNVISDVMDTTLNHADCKHYDSKSKYYRAVKEAGCEVVGNDSSIVNPPHREHQPQDIAKDIKSAIDKHS
jgi:hypothetical protein